MIKMFRCKFCKTQSSKGESSFMVYEFRKKSYSERTEGFETKSAKISCPKCYIKKK